MVPSQALFLDHPEIRLPLRVVKAERGIGSFLTIDLLGEDASMQSDGPTKWMIWIYLSDWVLRDGQADLLDSGCTDSTMYEQCLSKLEKAELKRAVAVDAGETCELSFSNGFELFIDDASDIYGQESEMLMIFRDGECAGVFKAGKGLVHR